MYIWYANCKAVVLDSGTSLDLWRSRGWCLQEGAAAGILYGISEGKLVSIQSLAKAQNVYLCKLDLSLYYRLGNAAEILARMDMRQTERQEDMAYALAGIFSVHLTLAYGEEEKARNRLLQELAIQKGDVASRAWLRAVADDAKKADAMVIFDDLRQYCTQDTLAMVRIHEVLMELQKTAPGVQMSLLG